MLGAPRLDRRTLLNCALALDCGCPGLGCDSRGRSAGTSCQTAGDVFVGWSKADSPENGAQERISCSSF